MTYKLDMRSDSLVIRDEAGKIVHYDETYWNVPEDHPNREARFKELWDNVERMLQNDILHPSQR